MSEVIEFDGETRLPMDPDRILEAAKGELDSALVLGFDKEGGFYLASSDPDARQMIWALETAKAMLMVQVVGG